MLSLRIITAIILLAAVISGILYLPLWAFSGAVTLIAAMGAWEMSSMFWRQSLVPRQLFFGLLVGIFLLNTLFLSSLTISLAFVFCGALWWLVAPGILVNYTLKKTEKMPTQKGYFLVTGLSPEYPQNTTSLLLKCAIGICVFVPFAISLIVLQDKFSHGHLLYVLALVWANDIGAYFAGSLYGKNLLAPVISPKKSWEGLFGGIILGAAVIICGGFLLKIHGIRWVPWVMLSIIVSLWSTIGDLFESMLKRQANIKDSGRLLPGHGGIYDRIDSLTAALPLFTAGAWLLNL